MPSYTVTEILSSRPWPSSEETKVIYYDVKVDGQDQTVNLGRKPTNPLAVGAVLDGTLERGDRGGLRFVRAQSQNGGGRGGKPVEERRSIAMQASQKVAVDVVRIAVDAGLWQPQTPEGVAAAVRKIAGELYGQVNEVSA